MSYFMVSIVIPYYNGEMFIEKTIDSCYRQTYSDIEVIIADDNSPTPVPATLLERYPNIKVIRNTTNQGFCKNSNIGVSTAQGEYIIVLGQDDMLPSNHIECMIKSFEENDVVVAYCGYHLIDEYDVDYKTGKSNYNKPELTMVDLADHSIHTCGLMMRRDAFLQVGGYPEDFDNFGEWELWIKMCSIGRIVFNEFTYGLYRRHRNNITNSFQDYDKYVMLYQFYKRCKHSALKLCKIDCKKRIRMYAAFYGWCVRKRIAIILRKWRLYQGRK